MPQKALGCTLRFIISVRLAEPKVRTKDLITSSSFFVVPVFEDFEHRNRKLFRVVCAHHLL